MNKKEFEALLKEQYESDPYGTIKAVMGFADEKLMTGSDAAVMMGCAPATFNGFWAEDINSADQPIRFAVSKIVENGAVESKVTRGRVYLRDVMATAKETRDKMQSERGSLRERAQSLVNKSDILKYAFDAGVTLTEGDEKENAIKLSERLAAVIGCDALQLRVAIKQDKDKAEEAAALRRSTLLASLKTVEPTK